MAPDTPGNSIARPTSPLFQTRSRKAQRGSIPRKRWLLHFALLAPTILASAPEAGWSAWEQECPQNDGSDTTIVSAKAASRLGRRGTAHDRSPIGIRGAAAVNPAPSPGSHRMSVHSGFGPSLARGCRRIPAPAPEQSACPAGSRSKRETRDITRVERRHPNVVPSLLARPWNMPSFYAGSAGFHERSLAPIVVRQQSSRR
jgi:hypothetical protein